MTTSKTFKYYQPATFGELQTNLQTLRTSNDLWRLPEDTVLSMIEEWVEHLCIVVEKEPTK